MRGAFATASLALLLAGAAHAQHALVDAGPYDAAVPTPRSVLGYEVGERFTPHHLLMRYLDRVAASSRRVRIDTVAHSFEGREVVLVSITSEANHERISAIRADARRIADPRGATPGQIEDAAGMPAIVWLGYTVHGPEASGVEAAIALIYQLAAGQDAQTQLVLDSTVVLIDPLQNPDGHERHAQDVMRRRPAWGVPTSPYAMIHSGTWPGARTSHYYFDLNRDWYAQSHPETRGRVASMLEWWPHVAVDVHEMGSNSTYFFPPAMDPVNRIVHRNILDWWDVYAGDIIAAFDHNAWSFFRREGYDEFYPGYGSSWPLYTGAVGMTFEQASSGGGAVERTDGTVLTLEQAARQHYTAVWATLLGTAARRDQRVRDYIAYRRSAVTEGASTPLRTVVFERDAQGRADSLARSLLRNGIEVGRNRSNVTIRDARLYGGDGRAAIVNAGAGGVYTVDLAQPMGRLARALLEPDAPLDSSFIGEELERRRTGQSDRFYDLTAFSLPFTFNVRAWGTSTAVGPVDAVTDASLAAMQPAASADARYGYAFAPGSESSIRLLASLLADSVRVWYAPRPFRSGATDFPAGGFVVRVESNRAGVHDVVRRHAAAAGASVVPLASARADAGTDLGSNSVFPIIVPRIAVLAGTPISGQSFGYAWYAFDQRIGYRTTALEVGTAIGAALDEFNVLIVPSVSAGAFDRVLGDGGRDRIRDWVRAGGLLITIDAATEWVAREGPGIARLRVLRDTVREGGDGFEVSVAVPGAFVRAEGDTLSPIMAGVQRQMPTLVFSGRALAAPTDVAPGEVALRYAAESELRIAGYLWPEAPARIAGRPVIWTERVGRGRVIAFAGDPNFRDLWRSQLPLFANAVFMGLSY